MRNHEDSRYALTECVIIHQSEGIGTITKETGIFDIVPSDYYDPYFLKYLEKKPYVITVHDMIHEIVPDIFPTGDPKVPGKTSL